MSREATELSPHRNWHGKPESLDRLRAIIPHVSYKPGWKIILQNTTVQGEQFDGSTGWHLGVAAHLPESSGNGETDVLHWFAVPPADWSSYMWKVWIFQCVLDVEKHESMEFFSVAGNKVFYPEHGVDTLSPYIIQF